jgi:hypothetical protein
MEDIREAKEGLEAVVKGELRGPKENNVDTLESMLLPDIAEPLDA